MRRLLGAALAAAFLSANVVLSTGGAAHAAAVPAGFADSAVAGASSPTTVEWLPNDRIVVLEQAGRVRIGTTDGAFTTALTIANICPGFERGLLGFTHDPAFLSNGLVYVYYTREAASAPGSCVNRVSRFATNGDVIDPASEVVLIDNISSVNGNHNGGDLDFGSNGFLYVAVGDAGRDPRGDSGSGGSNDAAQDLSLLNGKILRITRDGEPAPGNPLMGANTERCATRGNTPATPTTSCQEIFAYGLRNPYRFAFDRNDGSDRFFINDVGQATYEEIDQGSLGANYGWPAREGGCPAGDTTPCPGPPPGVTDPIAFYPRSVGQFITAGAFVPNGLWPAEYDGAYLFADGGSGQIWARSANGSIDYADPFATGAGGISDMTFGFDTAGRLVLYYVQNGGGLRKITPTAPPASNALQNLQLATAISPTRVYDTGAGGIESIGVAAGRVVNGTTRRIDLDAPAEARAALVNVTYADNPGVGFITLWGTRALRPPTSSLNADAPVSVGANAAIVPLDSSGSFVLEASMSGRVIVDLMGWFMQTAGAVSEGRYVALSPTRLVDTRVPAGTTLPGGSDNPYQRNAESKTITFSARGRGGVPTATGDATAVVISVAAIGKAGGGGYVGVPGAGPDTSIVNVLPGDARANMAIVDIDDVTVLRAFEVADVVIDVLGYFTGPASGSATTGLYSSIEPVRVVDTRIDLGIAAVGNGAPQTIPIPGSSPAVAVVQNVTVTQPTAPGYLSTYPATGTTPLVSTVNFFPGQTRATLALTTMSSSRQVSYEALVPTEMVVDVIGFFSA